MSIIAGVDYRIRYVIINGQIEGNQFNAGDLGPPLETYIIQAWPHTASAMTVNTTSAWAQAWKSKRTRIGQIYDMSFTFMPELGWPSSYPFAVATMRIGGLFSTASLRLVTGARGVLVRRPYPNRLAD